MISEQRRRCGRGRAAADDSLVPVKTDEQLDLARSTGCGRLVSERTAINQIRGFLERGVVVRQGLRFLRQLLPDILAKRNGMFFHHV